jgi:hypothetical protein
VLVQGVACGGSLVIRHVQIMPQRMLPFDRRSRKTHSLAASRAPVVSIRERC